MVGVRSGSQLWTAHRVAAALAFASELLLLWVLPQEFAPRPLTGSFVFLAAVCQGVLAAKLLPGPGRWAARLGILLNATIVSVWLVTRFSGFPAAVGFAQLPVEPPGLAATIAEVALIVLLVRIGQRARLNPRRQAL